MENKNEFLYADFEVKSADEATGMIEGYASVFGNRDSYSDIVEKGSFVKTLKETGGKVPVLSNHDYTKQIGWGTDAEENNKGLFVRGQLEINDIPEARAHYALIKRAKELGAKAGMSFGFQTVKYEIDKNATVRRLTELKLLEWSPVTFPANPKAFATAAKAWFHESSLEESITLFVDQLKKIGHNDIEIKQTLERAVTQLADPDKHVQSLAEKIDNAIEFLRQN